MLAIFVFLWYNYFKLYPTFVVQLITNLDHHYYNLQEELMNAIYWISINYHLPMSPSKARVYVWRKLRELGAENINQGVAILPSSEQNIHAMEQLAVKIEDMQGDATVTEMRFLDPVKNDKMIQIFRNQTQDELLAFYLDAVAFYKQLGANKDECLRKFSKKYEKIRKRDYFNAGKSLEKDKKDFFTKFFNNPDHDQTFHQMWRDIIKSKDGVVQKLIPPKATGNNI